MLKEHLRFAHRVDGQLVDAVENGVAELQEPEYFVISARYLLVDLAGEALQTRVKRHFQAGETRVVALRLKPLYIEAHVIEKLAHFEAVIAGAYGHHLVQRRFDLNAAAHKACGNAAGQVVPLKDQHIQPLVRQHKR